MKNKFIALLTPLLILVSLTTAGCGATATGSTRELAMAPMSGMPDEVKAAPVVVQQAYQFAVANPDALKQIPCYCGCGKMGHKSNYMCYVKDAGAAGKPVAGKPAFDTHALGCSICVDITQDVMRLSKEGKSPPDIRAYVDATYAQYGPSNLSD
jgi:hypothetical protein